MLCPILQACRYAMRARCATGSATPSSTSRKARILTALDLLARGLCHTHVSQLADIRLTTRVNGELRQDDRTSQMIFSFRKIINYISTFTTLVPGDMIVCTALQPALVRALIHRSGSNPAM